MLKSAKHSSEPLLVIRISPFRVKIMDLSSKLIIQPTTSPTCQQRPNRRLPTWSRWPWETQIIINTSFHKHSSLWLRIRLVLFHRFTQRCVSWDALGTPPWVCRLPETTPIHWMPSSAFLRRLLKVRSHQKRMKRYAQMIYMLSQCKDAIDNPAVLFAWMAWITLRKFLRLGCFTGDSHE